MLDLVVPCTFLFERAASSFIHRAFYGPFSPPFRFTSLILIFLLIVYFVYKYLQEYQTTLARLRGSTATRVRDVDTRILTQSRSIPSRFLSPFVPFQLLACSP